MAVKLSERHAVAPVYDRRVGISYFVAAHRAALQLESYAQAAFETARLGFPGGSNILRHCLHSFPRALVSLLADP